MIRKCNAIDKIIFNMDNKTLSLKCEQHFVKLFTSSGSSLQIN